MEEFKKAVRKLYVKLVVSGFLKDVARAAFIFLGVRYIGQLLGIEREAFIKTN